MKLKLTLCALLITAAACGSGSRDAAKPDEAPQEPPAVAAAASLNGTYKMAHTISVLDEDPDATQEVQDCAFIETMPDGGLKFELGLIGDRDKRCSLDGVAEPNGEDRWSYVENVEDDMCNMEIIRLNDRIMFKEIEGSCSPLFCGAGLSFESAEFMFDSVTPGDTCQP